MKGEYRSQLISELERDGLFFSLFNKMLDKFEERIPHLLLSRFDLFSEQKVFYTLLPKEQEINSDNVILLFHLNPITMPLVALEDFLKWFNKFKGSHHFNKIAGCFSYSLKMNVESDQKYMHDYYSLLSRYLGQVPESLSLLDIEKKADFKNMLVIEGATQWATLDNYLVHLILSKGGKYYQPGLSDIEFDVESLEELSPFHSLAKVRLKKAHPEILKCPFVSDLKEKNFFQNPEDLLSFNYLMYQNIWK